MKEWVSERGKKRERERHQVRKSEQQKRERGTNRELHSGPIHRHIIQSDMTIHLCDPSIHIGPHQASHRCIIHTHTHTKHTSAAYTATRHLYHYGESSQFIFIHSFLPPWREHIAQIFYGAYSCKVHRPQNVMNVFSAKVGVRVYPLASHNIDRAALSGSKLQPCSRNIGQQTGGSMSMWGGAYRPIKAAVPIPIGRRWWTAHGEREGGRLNGAKCYYSPVRV